jgi:hypothetical protein
MMDVKRMNMFSASALPVMIVVTTNATIKNNGALVMGRGAAKDLRDKIPGIDTEIGDRIITFSNVKQDMYQPVIYGFLDIRSPYRPGKGGIGIFQVKKEFRDDADLSLIASSCILLKKWMASNPNVKVQLNYPGIGNGRLKFNDVKPIILSFFKGVENITFCLKPQTSLPVGTD